MNAFGSALNFLTVLLTLVVSCESVENMDAKKKLDTIDSFLNLSRDALKIPGMSVAVITNGQIAFTKGYGVLNYSEEKPVTESSLFAIASCTKPFTSFLLGMLVEDGLLNWDDRVIQHIPEFRLTDEYRTHHLTIRDLLSHRTGQPRHDGVWRHASFPRNELLERIPYLQPNYQLREKWQYTNIMYTLAAIVAEKVKGQSWEDMIRNLIFSPLNMTRSDCSIKNPKELEDVATPYSEKSNGQVAEVPWDDVSIVGPGGSVVSSAKDMAKWIQAQLQVGEQNLLRKETLDEMHTIQMAVQSSPGANNSFIGYGLGWAMGFHRGRYMVWHNGEIDGFSSFVGFLPEEKIGAVILMNSDSHLGFFAPAINQIFDILLDYPTPKPEEWVSNMVTVENEAKEGSRPENDTSEHIDRPEEFTGKFFNPGYKYVEVYLNDSQLYASHENNLFLLKPKKGRDFFGATEPDAPPLNMQLEYECSFSRNHWGDVIGCRFNFEVMVEPIFFEKEVPSEFLEPKYLKRFIGTYQNPVLSLIIRLDGNRLISSSGEMKPWKRNIFHLKGVLYTYYEFITSNDGKVSTLNVHTNYMVYPLEPQKTDKQTSMSRSSALQRANSKKLAFKKEFLHE